jgi:N-hydroxyarylamine O-acetyltransferase
VLTGPLRLAPDVPHETPHEPFRLALAAGEYTLEASFDGDWKPLYRFDLQEQHPIDYVATSYYLSTSPASYFTNALVAARTEPGRRYALRNHQLAIHHTGGPTERTALASARELRGVLEATFGIAVPEDPALEAALARFATAAG